MQTETELYQTDVQLLSYADGSWAATARAMLDYWTPDRLAQYKAGTVNPPSKGGLSQKQASCMSQAVRAAGMLPRQRKDSLPGLYRIFALPVTDATPTTQR